MDISYEGKSENTRMYFYFVVQLQEWDLRIIVKQFRLWAVSCVVMVSTWPLLFP
jgi:hypothetical protein